MQEPLHNCFRALVCIKSSRTQLAKNLLAALTMATNSVRRFSNMPQPFLLLARNDVCAVLERATSVHLSCAGVVAKEHVEVREKVLENLALHTHRV